VDASPLQLLTTQPVLALGGFTGADPILTTNELAQFVADGKVRFFLVEHREPIDSEKVEWLIENCALLPNETVPVNMDLYDCPR
jgi:hypothetical protein